MKLSILKAIVDFYMENESNKDLNVSILIAENKEPVDVDDINISDYKEGQFIIIAKSVN